MCKKKKDVFFPFQSGFQYKMLFVMTVCPTALLLNDKAHLKFLSELHVLVVIIKKKKSKALLS